MKSSLPWALLILLGGVWLFLHDRSVKERAGLTISVDSLSRALSASQSHDLLRQRESDSLSKQVDSLKSAKSKVLRHVDTVQVRVAVQESVFVSTLPDSLKKGFATIIAVNDSIINQLRGVILGDSLAMGKKDQQLALRGSSLEECRQGLNEAVKQRDRALHLAQPPFFTRVVRAVPAVAIGALGALILRR